MNSWGSNKTIKLSLTLRAALFPIVIFPLFMIQSDVLKISILVLIFISMGLTWSLLNVASQYLLTHLAPGKVKGQVFGAYNAAIGFSGIVGALIGGFVARYFGYPSAFILATLFVLVGLFLSAKIEKEV